MTYDWNSRTLVVSSRGLTLPSSPNGIKPWQLWYKTETLGPGFTIPGLAIMIIIRFITVTQIQQRMAVFPTKLTDDNLFLKLLSAIREVSDIRRVPQHARVIRKDNIPIIATMGLLAIIMIVMVNTTP